MNEIQRDHVIREIIKLRGKIAECGNSLPYSRETLDLITVYKQQITERQNQLTLGVFNEY